MFLELDVSTFYLDEVTVIPSICKYLSPPRMWYCTRHTHTHSLPLLPQRQDMSLSLIGNFLLMGLQTISCFDLSYCFDLWPGERLSWVQKLKIYRLSQVEEAFKKKRNLSKAFVVLLESWTDSRFFNFNLTQFFILTLIDELNSAGTNCLCGVLFLASGCSCLWTLKWCCFQAPCFYPSYLLIATFCLLFWLSRRGVVLNRDLSGFL